jgi:hypothetical protein
MTEPESQAGIEGFGRRILLTLGGGLVLLGGVLGLIVGGNGGDTVTELAVAGSVTIPVTPLAMSLYGMTVVALAIGGLYGLVMVASRFDSNAG